jgi:V/A-type H+-transporting ATPase subunit I
MLKPQRMQRASLQVLRDDAPRAAMVLAAAGVFDAEPVDDPSGNLKEQPAERYRQVYQQARARLAKLSGFVDCAAIGPLEARDVPLEELEALDERLGGLWRRFSALEEEARRLEEEGTALRQLSASLAIFADLKVDLSLFQAHKGFLTLRLGTVPTTNLSRLREAAAIAGYLITPFHSELDLHYVVAAGPAQAAAQVDTLLRTAGFRTVSIPAEFRDYPEKIRGELDARARTLEARRAEQGRAVAELVDRHGQEVRSACATLLLAQPYAELAQRLRGRGGLAVVEGWIPADRVAQLQQELHARLDRPHVLGLRDPRPDEMRRVPTLVRHHRLLAPFAALARNYGVPRYGEFDPTLLFAATFVAMFGMMFGDVGHGAVFIAIGLLLRRRWPLVLPFMAAAGLSSMAFGFVYGSIFGYEHLIHPLWMAPLSDPLLMLELALYWGIGFILVATGLTIYNRISEGDWAAALLDSKGLAGVALYVGGLYAGFAWVGAGRLGWPEGAAILGPLLVVLGYKWHAQQSPWGERVLVVAVEGFEAVMNYLANTLSFLRVAAFSLNHVALAVAVFTLADMMDTAGHWVTVVLGNLFIIGLEGAIVTIQVLRLEYYEGFSRYFRGDGREFRPLQYPVTVETHHAAGPG